MKARLGAVWGWCGRWFHWIALVGVAIGLVIAVRGQWEAITDLDWAGAWRVIAVAALLFAVAPLAQAVSFWVILRFLGAKAPFGEAMVIWGHSYVLRYAPSGALAVVYRVRAKDRLGATREQILIAEAYEHLGSLAAGACALLGGFIVLATLPPWLGLGVAIPVILVAIAIRPKFLGGPAQRLLRRRGIDGPILRGRELILVISLNLLAWPCTGAGLLVIANGLTDKGSPGLSWAIATYSVAFLVGFVVPLLPGGLGAREGTLIAVLAKRYGAGAATGIALATRVATTLGEAAAVAVILAVAFVGRRVGLLRRSAPSV